MKKKVIWILKTLLLLIVIMMIMKNYCFADVASTPSISSYPPSLYLGVLVGVALILTISIALLKIIYKKNQLENNEEQKDNSEEKE